MIGLDIIHVTSSFVVARLVAADGAHVVVVVIVFIRIFRDIFRSILLHIFCDAGERIQSVVDARIMYLSPLHRNSWVLA